MYSDELLNQKFDSDNQKMLRKETIFEKVLTVKIASWPKLFHVKFIEMIWSHLNLFDAFSEITEHGMIIWGNITE